MRRLLLLPLAAVSLAPALAAPPHGHGVASAEPPSVLLDTMATELHRAMDALGSGPGSPKPYFLSYTVADTHGISISSEFGAITNSVDSRRRTADVQIRIGTREQDNTHGANRASALTTVPLPLTDDASALSHSLWFATNRGYGRALDSYLKVQTEAKVRAKEEDSSADFTDPAADKPAQAILPVPPRFAPAAPVLSDKAVWEGRLREVSGIFTRYPDVLSNTVELEASDETDAFVSSEGGRLLTPTHVARLVVVARTRAADGMELYRDQTWEADSLAGLPDQKTLMAAVTELAKGLEALRAAPITEPFNGPAILSGRASAVFFHEVLGHRLEGQRQRGDEEGQTFTRLLNKAILPSFLSVADDPTLREFHGIPLSGHYAYDDEGQPAQRVELIQDGVLKTFLMSRLPIANFASSNGHGRAQTGRMPTGRQGNLIVTSTRQVPDAELREMLKAEAKKQGKPYGLFFEDISSGFAVTTRDAPQAFSVQPLVVYRVFVDGRPDELVRGVSIVGTPQAALNRILATGNRQDVFNGICGAESGSIPVSAVAPAMLVSEIETQRESQGTARPPIVPPPSLTAKTQ